MRSVMTEEARGSEGLKKKRRLGGIFAQDQTAPLLGEAESAVGYGASSQGMPGESRRRRGCAMAEQDAHQRAARLGWRAPHMRDGEEDGSVKPPLQRKMRKQ